MGTSEPMGVPVARPLNPEDLHQQALAETPLSPEEQRHLAAVGRFARGEVDIDDDDQPQSFEPVAGVNPLDLASTGWGIVFGADESAEVREALKPLCAWRKACAGSLYRDLTYTPGMTKGDLLPEASGRGPVDPKNGPYYLLLVGSPARIPFEIQYQLDVQYGVGRIDFEDPADYRRYAENVVATERDGLLRPKKAGFFGVATPGDDATKGSVTHFINPLATFTERKKWTVERRVEGEAMRARLQQMLRDGQTLMATATHGAKPLMNNPLLKTHTGALLCQDFPGPLTETDPPPAHCFFAAKDVPEEADLRGSIFLLFACYGAGAPQFEDFLSPESTKRQQVSDVAFVSALPKELLRRGALAVVAHVERAYYFSFEGLRNTEQLQTFESVWDRLLAEMPVGFAMEYMNGRYAELAAELTGRLLKAKDLAIRAANTGDLANTWMMMNDARNYCVIGDPAVRICVTERTRKLLMTSGTKSAGPVAAMARPLEEPDLEELTERLAALLEKPVEVTTLVGEGGPVAARTKVGLDGQVVNEISTEDAGLRQLHAQAVEKAMGERAELARLVKEVMERTQ